MSSIKISSFENKQSFVVKAVEDPETGDIVLPFPESLMKDLDWKVGDVLNWDDSDMTKGVKITNKSLEERKDEKIFIVETISQFKIRYAVRAESLDVAKELVKQEKTNELDQDWVGETLLGGYMVTEEEFLSKESVNEYNGHWTKEQKMGLINNIEDIKSDEDGDLV